MTAPPSPYAPPAGWGHPPPASSASATDAWSVASLVTALLGLSLVGAVCGVVGVRRTARGARRGRGLAVVGLAVSTVVLLLQVLLVVSVGPEVAAGVRDGFRDATASDVATDDVATDDVATDDLAADDVAADAAAPGDGPGDGAVDGVPPADGEAIDSDALEVGQCFDDPEGETFYEIDVLPCDVPHDGEVVASVTLEGTAYPGETEVDDLGWEGCTGEVVDVFDAAGVDGSAYDLWTFTPTKESWVLYGDREVLCLAYGLDGPLGSPVLP